MGGGRVSPWARKRGDMALPSHVHARVGRGGGGA